MGNPVLTAAQQIEAQALSAIERVEQNQQGANVLMRLVKQTLIDDQRYDKTISDLRLQIAQIDGAKLHNQRTRNWIMQASKEAVAQAQAEVAAGDLSVGSASDFVTPEATPVDRDPTPEEIEQQKREDEFSAKLEGHRGRGLCDFVERIGGTMCRRKVREAGRCCQGGH